MFPASARSSYSNRVVGCQTEHRTRTASTKLSESRCLAAASCGIINAIEESFGRPEPSLPCGPSEESQRSPCVTKSLGPTRRATWVWKYAASHQQPEAKCRHRCASTRQTFAREPSRKETGSSLSDDGSLFSSGRWFRLRAGSVFNMRRTKMESLSSVVTHVDS